MHKHYVNYLKELGYLPAPIEDSLVHRIKVSIVAKDKFLLNTGEICRQLVFVKSGYFRIFELTDGIKRTRNIIGPNNHLYIPDSYLFQNISSLGIECICKSEIISISFHEWSALIHYSNDYAQLILKALLSEQTFYQKQLSVWGRDKAKQRFILLKEKYPQIDLAIKQAYIADFLNISTIHLSRIKKEILTTK